MSTVTLSPGSKRGGAVLAGHGTRTTTGLTAGTVRTNSSIGFDTTAIGLLLETGFSIYQETGVAILLNEPESTTDAELLQENGYAILKEDNYALLVGDEVFTTPAALLDENSYSLLLETGFALLLDEIDYPFNTILDPYLSPVLGPSGEYVTE